ncbi:expressed unknown protein [Seminavis robusta]|uniref:CRAL-TRIO domain-containing protein n=1 Tax=Seminavis robusta TaxID=568900 RepID=A0A9N8H8Y7_9STRA|nr:expressed unknown protein [Seminavis robusta]|eukprot:Sro236_g094890.1 n/a (431) ;mRNA; r:10769-12242
MYSNKQPRTDRSEAPETEISPSDNSEEESDSTGSSSSSELQEEVIPEPRQEDRSSSLDTEAGIHRNGDEESDSSGSSSGSSSELQEEVIPVPRQEDHSHSGTSSSLDNVDGILSNDEDGSLGSEGDHETNSEHEESDYDDEEVDLIGNLLQDPLCHQHSTMMLTQEEQRWALQLKEAVVNRPDLDEENDMWLAQYAIVTEGDISNALKRIARIQAFQKQYGVNNSVEQGLEMLSKLFQLFPGGLLCLDVDPVKNEGLHVMNNGKHNYIAAMESEENWRSCMVGCYYYFLVCQPTLATIRNGHQTMGDFGSFDWDNLKLEFCYQFNLEMGELYPITFTKFLAFNTGTLANMFWSLVKNVYSKALISKLQLGCRVPLGEEDEVPRSLSDIYLQPSLEETNKRMLVRARQLFTLRARNEANFRLHQSIRESPS